MGDTMESVMVTFNVETDLDIANGSRGKITKIVLDERETGFTPTPSIVELAYPPAYILVKMNRTKAVQLAGLEKNVLPLVPLERTFTITHGKGQKSIKRRQLPITQHIPSRAIGLKVRPLQTRS